MTDQFDEHNINKREVLTWGPGAKTNYYVAHGKFATYFIDQNYLLSVKCATVPAENLGRRKSLEACKKAARIHYNNLIPQ